MPVRMATTDPDFPARFQSLVDGERGAAADIAATVAAVLADVRARGDAALLDYTRRWDRVDLTPGTLRVEPDALAAAARACDRRTLDALALAAERIRAFHERQRPAGLDYRDDDGVRLGLRWTPLDSVGLYVPGGTAAYPSSVLMNAIPARVAGVKRVAMAVPTPDGALNPLVLAAAQVAGVTEVYRMGGAQAVAAFAYGTESVAPVDKITGPGNAYVAEAKRQVFGTVGIDSVAGPSEVLVVADRTAPPDWIAADLLAQAEHDSLAQSILITDDGAYADQVVAALEGLLDRLDRAAVARASWQDHGAVILVRDLLGEAPALIDRLAPEHLQLAMAGPEALADRVTHAGAIFLGVHTPEALGDYLGGPNHVLPTARTARFASGLGVIDFMKRTTLLGCPPGALASLGPPAVVLAEAEGLGAHGLSVALRLEGEGRLRGDGP